LNFLLKNFDLWGHFSMRFITFINLSDTSIYNVFRPTLSAPSFIACKRWTGSQRRYSTAEALATPQAEGEEKVYDPKIQKLVEDIGSLTLLEVADLNELLKVSVTFSAV